ncbi:hypothetical protein PHLGIDRAFT_120043 [Phlebiopsis gigantea 11061_1 CR5-6]|uniref:Uncharacterized protein n=1 Tax=Phlebiopsis gigantea (strain 11061_1 CR5-6) TaxID=745531 RepID=A0A0C3S8B9_PHLG1|nr:hypothetical protein PHLGIDRAFT_120043 [Phlebiopsis gigantea 11061_1 CR5-6]
MSNDTAPEEPPAVASARIPTSRVIPTEVCERIIDVVAVRRNAVAAYADTLFWDKGVRATLDACSRTCRAWRTRSQLHLMRDMSVRASITGYMSFGDLRALLHTIPLLQGNLEDLAVGGWVLDIPQ